MPLRHSARRASTDTASAGKKVPTTVTSAEREHRALHDALGTDGDRVGAAHWPPRLRPLVKGGSGSTADIMQPRLPTTSGRSIPFEAAFWAPGEYLDQVLQWPAGLPPRIDANSSGKATTAPAFPRFR